MRYETDDTCNKNDSAPERAVHQITDFETVV